MDSFILARYMYTRPRISKFNLWPCITRLFYYTLATLQPTAIIALSDTLQNNYVTFDCRRYVYRCFNFNTYDVYCTSTLYSLYRYAKKIKFKHQSIWQLNDYYKNNPQHHQLCCSTPSFIMKHYSIIIFNYAIQNGVCFNTDFKKQRTNTNTSLKRHLSH